MRKAPLDRFIGTLFFLSIVVIVLWAWHFSYHKLTAKPSSKSAPVQHNATKDAADIQSLLRDRALKGKRPEQFLFFNIMNLDSQPLLKLSPSERQPYQQLAYLIGSNSVPQATLPRQNAFWRLPTNQNAASPDWPERTRIVWAQDLLPPIPYRPEDDAGFKVYLQQKHIDPKDLGLDTIENARLEWSNLKSPLAYHSFCFAFNQYAHHIKQRQTPLLKNAPSGVQSAAPLNAMMYEPNGLIPWGEDTALVEPEISPAAAGWLLTKARHAALTNQTPLLWTLYAGDHVNNPTALRRAFYLSLAHGSKMFYFRGACPPSLASDDGSITPQDRARWQTLQDLIHEVGWMEELLYTAMPRPAEVAIYDSPAQRLYQHPDDEEERRALFLAMRAAGHAVDVITADDIRAGKHKHLKAIVIVGMNVERDIANLLRQWVRDDAGTLGGYAGGGFRDEYDQPLRTLDEVYGVTDVRLVRRSSMGRPKREWPYNKPVDRFLWDHVEVKREFPAMGCRLTIKPVKEAILLAKFQDGSPAIIRHDYGRGMGILYGGYAASGFWQKALPTDIWSVGSELTNSNQVIPHEWDKEIVDQVTVPSSEARWNVVTDNLKVETMVMDSPKGVVVIIINWDNQPQDAFLTVQYSGAKYNKATSLEQGPLKMTKMVDPNKKTAATYSFRIKVRVTDAVLLEP